MHLLSLSIYNVRTIKQAHLTFSKGINLIQGINGSGKTSLLEAVYHLGVGNSFKTRESKKVISSEESFLSVRGELSNFSSLAVQKFLSKQPIVKVNDGIVRCASDLARYLPMQVIYEGVFDIINSGSSVRRRFLDWGLFHVEQSYHQLLSAYNQALAQKNALLKGAQKDKGLLSVWDNLLAELGVKIHQYRDVYFSNLIPVFLGILSELKPGLELNVKYIHGWGQSLKSLDKSTLLAELSMAHERDFQQKCSSKGAHKADIKFYFNDYLAKENLSRGQQKIASIALMMAQSKLISKECLFLMDDLAAELDVGSIRSICKYFNQNNYQVIITTLDTVASLFQEFTSAYFTVADGHVSRET